MPSLGKISLANATRGVMVVIAFTLALGLSTKVGRAEDVRIDPFQPTSSADEERKIEDRDRVKAVIREMLPEIKAKVMEDMEAQKAFTVEEARKAAIEAMRSDPALQNRSIVADVGGAVGGMVGAAAKAAGLEPTKLPDGAKFIACVDGKALYKDPKENVNFFRDFAPGVMTPCMIGKLAAESPKKEPPAPAPVSAPMPANPSMPPRAPGAPGVPPAPPAPPATPAVAPAVPRPAPPKMSGVVRPMLPAENGRVQTGTNVAMRPPGT